MSIGITIATVMFCFYLYQYLEEKRKAKEEEEENSCSNNKSSDNHEDMKVGDSIDERTITELVTDTLSIIGCVYEIEEEDLRNYISFTYQGEHFTIECRNDYYYITIYDTWWYQISVYSDVEEIADLHKTINLANQYANCTLIYTTNQEIEQIGVHSKKNMLFMKEIPDLDKYLISTLDDLFKVQRFVMTELEKSKVTENNSIVSI